MLIVLLTISGLQFSTIDIWSLRSGYSTGGVPQGVWASLYFSAVTAYEDQLFSDQLLTSISRGDRSMIVPLTSRLVASGNTDLAGIYWNTSGTDLPATRNDLLNALSWQTRYDLYRVMAGGPVVPPDMEGAMYSGQCAAICFLGWMSVRSNGDFRPDDLVSPSDIQLLSQYFGGFPCSLKYLPLSALDSIFRYETGVL